jgi:platelet-activating factor acetylhydrolase IB subunit alpha
LEKNGGVLAKKEG